MKNFNRISGFTLLEVLLVLSTGAFLGLTFTKVLVYQQKFMQRHQQIMEQQDQLLLLTFQGLKWSTQINYGIIRPLDQLLKSAKITAEKILFCYTPVTAPAVLQAKKPRSNILTWRWLGTDFAWHPGFFMQPEQPYLIYDTTHSELVINTLPSTTFSIGARIAPINQTAIFLSYTSYRNNLGQPHLALYSSVNYAPKVALIDDVYDLQFAFGLKQGEKIIYYEREEMSDDFWPQVSWLKLSLRLGSPIVAPVTWFFEIPNMLF